MSLVLCLVREDTMNTAIVNIIADQSMAMLHEHSLRVSEAKSAVERLREEAFTAIFGGSLIRATRYEKVDGTARSQEIHDDVHAAYRRDVQPLIEEANWFHAEPIPHQLFCTPRPISEVFKKSNGLTELLEFGVSTDQLVYRVKKFIPDIKGATWIAEGFAFWSTPNGASGVDDHGLAVITSDGTMHATRAWRCHRNLTVNAVFGTSGRAHTSIYLVVTQEEYDAALEVVAEKFDRDDTRMSYEDVEPIKYRYFPQCGHCKGNGLDCPYCGHFQVDPDGDPGGRWVPLHTYWTDGEVDADVVRAYRAEAGRRRADSLGRQARACYNRNTKSLTKEEQFAARERYGPEGDGFDLLASDGDGADWICQVVQLRGDDRSPETTIQAIYAVYESGE